MQYFIGINYKVNYISKCRKNLSVMQWNRLSFHFICHNKVSCSYFVVFQGVKSPQAKEKPSLWTTKEMLEVWRNLTKTQGTKRNLLKGNIKPGKTGFLSKEDYFSSLTYADKSMSTLQKEPNLTFIWLK